MLSESSTLRRYENGYLYVDYATTTNTYASGGGPVSQVSTSNYAMKNGNTYESRPSTQTNYTYGWWDTAQQASITYKPDINQGTTFTTSLYYDNNGHLTSAYIADGRPRNVAYVVDATGQILVRTESDNTSNGDPKQAWWFFDGKQLGTTGNDGNSDPDYTSALAERTATPPTTPGAFRLGSTWGTQYSDFDQAYNSLSPGEAGGPGATYIARGGDTLASVAQAVYGDSSLWYLIADANGFTGNTQLAAGQQIRVPSKLANVHNTSDTFRPYDAARSIGDLTPSTPKPPAKKKGGCGILGVILLAIVAVVVAIYAPEALHAVAHAIGGALGTSVGVSTALAGAVIGAGVSVVTQGIAVATGLQDKFSWKGVALGAIGGAIGQIGALGKLFQNVSSPFLKGALTAVVQNAVTQGVGVATGLQDKFSWSGVAAAGLSGGVLGALGPSSSFKGQALRAGAAVLTRAAAKSVIDGTDFGDNVVNELPDAIGQLVAQRYEAGQIAKVGKPQDLLAGTPYDDDVPLGKQDFADKPPSGGGGPTLGSSRNKWGVDLGPKYLSGGPSSLLVDVGGGSALSSNYGPNDWQNGLNAAVQLGTRNLLSVLGFNVDEPQSYGPEIVVTANKAEKDAISRLSDFEFYALYRPYEQRIRQAETAYYQKTGRDYDITASLTRLANDAYTVGHAPTVIPGTSIPKNGPLKDGYYHNGHLVSVPASPPKPGLIMRALNAYGEFNDRISVHYNAPLIDVMSNVPGASDPTAALIMDSYARSDPTLSSFYFDKNGDPIKVQQALSPLDVLGIVPVGEGISFASNMARIARLEGDVAAGLKIVDTAEEAMPVMRGIAFENAGAKAAQADAFLSGQSVRRLSVRAFDDAGNLLPGRTVLDVAGFRSLDELGAFEFKLHEGVSLTTRQAEHFPYLARNGGIVVGENGIPLGLKPLDRIGPLDVNRIDGPTLPLIWWPK